MDGVRGWLVEHYLTLKFAHLLLVMLWGFTAIGAFWVLVVAHRDAKRAPEDTELGRRRRWVFARFGEVVIIEHVCFPLVLLTGAALWWAADWPLSGSWLSVKLHIVLGVFVPMEIIDVALSYAEQESTDEDNEYDQTILSAEYRVSF